MNRLLLLLVLHLDLCDEGKFWRVPDETRAYGPVAACRVPAVPVVPRWRLVAPLFAARAGPQQWWAGPQEMTREPPAAHDFHSAIGSREDGSIFGRPALMIWREPNHPRFA